MNIQSKQQPAAAAQSGGTAERDGFVLADAQLAAQRPLRNKRLQQIAARQSGEQIDSAEKDLSDYLAKHPDDADALSLMARLKVRRGRRRDAIALLGNCLERAPDFAAARFNLANLLFLENRYRAALQELERLLEADSANPLFRQLKANVLEMMGENLQSLAICEQLARENSTRAESWIALGHAARATGHREQSIEAYRNAIACRPSYGQAWWSLANMKTVRFSDGDIAAMKRQIDHDDVTVLDRIVLQFALGKAFEDRGEYAKSFELCAKANAAMRLHVTYNADSLSARVAAYKAQYSREFFVARAGVGCPAADPIFILGQPRSGSTLIEQILSSHSDIEGTAELPYIPALGQQLEEGEGPAAIAKLTPSKLAELGEAYLEDARLHRKLGRPFFVDKRPGNWLYAGLIHLILPNAKIIDARRHPVAQSLSVFKNYFAKARPRLAEFGQLYRDYVSLMAHFDRVLPGRIHRVIYEEMVQDPERETRRLFAYLRIPFEENCLRFYETKRAVVTPSSEQVRRPISGEAVEHWRHYEPWLGPLITSLGAVFTDYPSVPADLA